jgi:polysaccharide pyruvyl transferase WcaK-like protein
MFNKPVVIGVAQSASPTQGTDKANLDAAMMRLGRNTGNMMFTESLCQVVKGATLCSFSVDRSEIEGADAIVLAAANWVNSYDDFGWLADRLELLKLPIFLVGVGVQSTASLEVPKVRPGTLRLLQLAQDSSASISVRGSFSCEVIEQLGIKNLSMTGCPSLLLAGPYGPRIAAVSSVEKHECVMHGTRHGFQKADIFQRYLYGQAQKSDIDIILQSELSDMMLALRAQGSDDELLAARDLANQTYGGSSETDVSNYLIRHAQIFFNVDDWTQYMKSKKFCLGTRIHGTVAALLSGTAAILITHDSRTKEMASSMGIPFIESSSLETDVDLDFNVVIATARQAQSVLNYSIYYQRFLSYFEKNGLEVAVELGTTRR